MNTPTGRESSLSKLSGDSESGNGIVDDRDGVVDTGADSVCIEEDESAALAAVKAFNPPPNPIPVLDAPLPFLVSLSSEVELSPLPFVSVKGAASLSLNRYTSLGLSLNR